MVDVDGGSVAQVQLTDDEVLALSAAGEDLFVPLPTVLPASEQDLILSVTRGQRSLGVRGLFSVMGEFEAEVNAIREAIAARPLLRTFLSDDGTVPFDRGAVTSFLGVAGSIVVDVTAPIGVHSFVEVSPADAFNRVAEAVSQVTRDGVGDASDSDSSGHPAALAFCVVCSTENGADLLIVRKGGARRGRIHSDGSTQDSGEVDPTLWLDAIARKSLRVSDAAPGA